MSRLRDYANAHVGHFFTANGNPPSSADGDLTGQCVTLDKWIMQNFSTVPNPFAARGDARYLGINLVNQGLADLIPAGQQKEGDLVCYEYGQYGHTGAYLDGNQLFQQNANTAGATKRVLADGTVVYSATIVTLYSSLGGVAPKFYRLKSFNGGNNMTHDQAAELSLYIRLLAFESVEEANSHSADDVSHMLADPGYAGAIAKAVYSGEWQLPAYKAGHYDSDTKANYNKGYAGGQAASGGGNLPVGSYIKVDPANVIEVKGNK